MKAGGQVVGLAKERGKITANSSLLSICLVRMGTKPPTDSMFGQLAELCATLCERYKWNPWAAVIGHAEWTSRKVDPSYLSMRRVRDFAAAILQDRDVGLLAGHYFLPLKRGAEGERVGLVQDKLVALGFQKDPGRWRGKFGPRTERAVKAFQASRRRFGMNVTGEVGEDTYRLLCQSVSKDVPAENSPPVPDRRAVPVPNRDTSRLLTREERLTREEEPAPPLSRADLDKIREMLRDWTAWKEAK